MDSGLRLCAICDTMLSTTTLPSKIYHFPFVCRALDGLYSPPFSHSRELSYGAAQSHNFSLSASSVCFSPAEHALSCPFASPKSIEPASSLSWPTSLKNNRCRLSALSALQRCQVHRQQSYDFPVIYAFLHVPLLRHCSPNMYLLRVQTKAPQFSPCSQQIELSV